MMANEANLNDEDDDTLSKVIPIDDLSPNHSREANVTRDSADDSDNEAYDDAAESDESDALQTARPLFASPNDLPDLRERHDDTPAGVTAPDTEDSINAESKSRDEFTTVYDIIDQMSSSIEETKSSIFAPGMVRLDRDEFLDQLGQLKSMLPVQLERASSLMREAERRLQNAQSEAQAIVAKAQSQAAQIKQNAEEQAQILAGQERVVDLAQRKARMIVDDARTRSTKLVQGANAYCADVMKALKEQVSTYDRDIRNGIDVIDKRQHEAAQQLEATEADALAQSQATATKTE